MNLFINLFQNNAEMANCKRKKKTFFEILHLIFIQAHSQEDAGPQFLPLNIDQITYF